MRKEVGELRHEEFPRAEKVWTRYRDQKTTRPGEDLWSPCQRHAGGLETDCIFTLDKYRGSRYVRKALERLLDGCGSGAICIHSTPPLLRFHEKSRRQNCHRRGCHYDDIRRSPEAVSPHPPPGPDLLLSKDIEAAGEYDPAVHGPLVEAALPPDYEELGRYWITEGLSLAVIARSIRTNQTEYFLFEPPLSDFEYELLERLFDDLRDVLILDDHDIISDRRAVLFRKMQNLLAGVWPRPRRYLGLQDPLLPRAQLPRLVTHRCVDERSPVSKISPAMVPRFRSFSTTASTRT